MMDIKTKKSRYKEDAEYRAKCNARTLAVFRKNKDKIYDRQKQWRKATGYSGKNGVALYKQKRDEQLAMSPDDLLRSLGFKFRKDGER